LMSDCSAAMPASVTARTAVSSAGAKPPDDPVDNKYIPARHTVARIARMAVQIFVKSTAVGECRGL
jgi:hypothetical protein